MTRILSRLPGIRLVAIQKQKLQLRRIRKVPCDASPLSRQFNQSTLKEILALEHLRDEWKSVEAKMASFEISDKPVGVNPGDRRALFYLMRSLRSASILEIGTATGASTVHAAAALLMNRADDSHRSHRLTTVDVLDVNDPQSRPWM